MSHPTQAQGLGKRPKRASRACDHCRWKRLKCSDEQKDTSCMNCIIYGTPCEYTPPWPPTSGKKKEPSSKPAGPKGRKSSSGRDERDSCSPHLLERHSSRSSSMADEGFHSPSTSTLSNLTHTRQSSTDYQTPMSYLTKDVLDEQLNHYSAFLNSSGANRNSPLEMLSEDMGFPSQQVTNALLQAYAQGFQAGIQAAQARPRSEMPACASRRSRPARDMPSSPMDYNEATMSALAMDHHHHHHVASVSPALSPNGTVQSPMPYDMHMGPGLGLESPREYPVPMHAVPGIAAAGARRVPAQALGQGLGVATPRSIPAGLDWEVFADPWAAAGAKLPGPDNRIPQDRYDGKFSFVMEDGFGQRRRGA